MDLRHKDYLTFTELTEHLKISISDLLHLVVMGKIMPSAHFNGTFSALFKNMNQLNEGDKDAISTYGYTSGYEAEVEVVCNGFFNLTHRFITGVNQCKFSRMTPPSATFQAGPEIDPQMDFVGVKLFESFHSDRLISEGAFLIADVQRFEKEYREAANDESANVKDISGKSETAYLNIIGALCELYWRAKRPKETTATFNQAEVIRDLMDEFPSAVGLKDRNLKDKLTKALRAIRSI